MKNNKYKLIKRLALGMYVLTAFTVSTVQAYSMEIDMSPVSAATSALGTLIGVGGGLWGAWGLGTAGFALKDQDGSEIKTGLFQLLGGVAVTGAGMWIGSLG